MPLCGDEFFWFGGAAPCGMVCCVRSRLTPAAVLVDGDDHILGGCRTFVLHGVIFEVLGCGAQRLS